MWKGTEADNPAQPQKDKGKGVQGWGEKSIGKEIAMQVKGLEFDYHNIFKKAEYQAGEMVQQ